MAIEVTVYCKGQGPTSHPCVEVDRFEAYPWEDDADQGRPLHWQHVARRRDVRTHELVPDGETATIELRCPKSKCRITARRTRASLAAIFQSALDQSPPVTKLPLVRFAG